tara:strand:+ start:4049 stop:4414 length:366 start_codon:yes stop_codon:yes gene_type:complete
MSYKTFDGTSQAVSANRSNRPTVETLGIPSKAYQTITTTNTSASTTLSSTITRISILCTDNDVRYAVGTGTVTAVQTGTDAVTPFIQKDERLDIKVPLNAKIAFISAVDGAAGKIEITELA